VVSSRFVVFMMVLMNGQMCPFSFDPCEKNRQALLFSQEPSWQEWNVQRSPRFVAGRQELMSCLLTVLSLVTGFPNWKISIQSNFNFSSCPR